MACSEATVVRGLCDGGSPWLLAPVIARWPHAPDDPPMRHRSRPCADGNEDVRELQAAISQSIGSDVSYQGRARRPDAVDGVSEFTIAWKNVAAVVLYQRRGSPAD
jgi:hypothetical protein